MARGFRLGKPKAAKYVLQQVIVFESEGKLHLSGAYLRLMKLKVEKKVLETMKRKGEKASITNYQDH